MTLCVVEQLNIYCSIGSSVTTTSGFVPEPTAALSEDDTYRAGMDSSPGPRMDSDSSDEGRTVTGGVRAEGHKDNELQEPGETHPAIQVTLAKWYN